MVLVGADLKQALLFWNWIDKCWENVLVCGANGVLYAVGKKAGGWFLTVYFAPVFWAQETNMWALLMQHYLPNENERIH